LLTLGCDISHWEGTIDWKAPADHLPLFVYMKCTDGERGFDNTFVQNHEGCLTAGIPHAPYHYFQPSLSPKVQAECFITKAGLGFKQYIVDLEEPFDPSIDYFFQVHQFLLRCQQLTAIKPAIYTSPGFWNGIIQRKPEWAHEYDLLVAHYTSEHSPTLPIGWDHWLFWQFSDHWYFPNIPCATDGDWFNGSLDQMRSWFGNYSQVDPPVYDHLQARSQFDQLHVRKAPRVSAPAVAHLMKGDQVSVDELGGTDVWIHHSQGWTCVEQDGYRYMEVVK
jgi:lysozyme